MKLESVCPLTTNSSSELFVFVGEDIQKFNDELEALGEQMRLHPKEVPNGDSTILVAGYTFYGEDCTEELYDLFAKYSKNRVE